MTWQWFIEPKYRVLDLKPWSRPGVRRQPHQLINDGLRESASAQSRITAGGTDLVVRGGAEQLQLVVGIRGWHSWLRRSSPSRSSGTVRSPIPSMHPWPTSR